MTSETVPAPADIVIHTNSRRRITLGDIACFVDAMMISGRYITDGSTTRRIARVVSKRWDIPRTKVHAALRRLGDDDAFPFTLRWEDQAPCNPARAHRRPVLRRGKWRSARG